MGISRPPLETEVTSTARLEPVSPLLQRKRKMCHVPIARFGGNHLR